MRRSTSLNVICPFAKWWLLAAATCLSGCGEDSKQAAQPAPNSGEIVPAGFSQPETAGIQPLQANTANNQKPGADDWEKELQDDDQKEKQPAQQREKPSQEKLTVVEPDPGTPEWLIREITKLRTQPVNILQKPIAGKPGETESVKLPDEQVPLERRRRSEQIIELASQAIALTHQDAARTQLFNNAVHYRADALLELALEGDSEQAATLNEDAELFYKRDPKSFAAVETSHRVLQLTLTQSQKYGDQEPRWTQALARQARLFAQRFPQEQSRAALFLMTAGKHCDQQGLQEDAKTCLGLVRTDFAKTPFAAQVEAPLRRLNLPGQPLTEFAGSTHDGGFIDIQQTRGKYVFIAFWESSSEKFRQDAPRIQQALASHADRVVPIGVNLDRDEAALDRYLETSPLPWRHIFYSDVKQRGMDNLVARYYGVAHSPQYWLIGPDGIVRSVNVKIEQLPQMLAQ